MRVAMVALAVHAILYRSLVPSDGIHGYLGWYAPLVGVLSAIALLLAGGVALARSTGVAVPLVSGVLPERAAAGDVSRAAGRLTAAAVGFLLLQETLERSIPARSFVLVQFTPLQWLIVLCATACVAGVLVSAGRGCRLLIGRARTWRSRVPARNRSRWLAPRSVVLGAWPPLASFSGLRAPPSPAHV